MNSFLTPRIKRGLAAGAVVAAFTVSLGFQAVMAQDATPEVTPADAGAAPEMPPLPGELVIGNLNAPRGIAFDADGNLLVTESGTGGDLQFTVPSTEDPAITSTINVGMTGTVLSVAADGTSTPLIVGLPSYAGEMEVTGIYRAIPQGDSLWLVVSKSGPGQYWSDSVVELDKTTLLAKNVINLTEYEAQNNPDGNELDSNVTDIAWGSDGTMYITNAGSNDLLSWTAEAGLATVAAWPDNAVPTSVEVAENGDLYVGFLGAGLAPGAGRIEHWSAGALVETFSGLNTITDILLDGDTLYAVQLVIFGETGPGPGSVIKVDASGATPVAEGLPAPFALAKGPDGALYVSFGTIAFAPGMTGGVIKLAM